MTLNAGELLGSAKMNATTSNWRVPEVEHFNRGFNEGTRYYNVFPEERKHGLKYIPPPKAEYLYQLTDEQKQY